MEPMTRDLDSRGYLEKRDRIFRVMGMTLRVGEIAAVDVPARSTLSEPVAEPGSPVFLSRL